MVAIGDGVNTVAIIGAGVAGLQTARALQKHGLQFQIFEEYEDVGGVWRANYSGYSLQVPWNVYEFPEFSYKEAGIKLGFLEQPSGPVVQQYVRAYADHFQLRPHIHFNARVQQVAPKGDVGSGWTVRWADGNNKGAVSESAFDFVVVASGRYSHPTIPAHYKDTEAFQGKLLPARFAQDPSYLDGKKVLVLGGGKTALDVAGVSARHAEQTTQLFRRAHYPVPYKVLGFLPATWIAYNRIGTSFLPPYYDLSSASRIAHTLTKPLKAFWWGFTKWAITTTLGLKGDLVPDSPVVPDLYIGGLLSERSHFDLVRSNKLNPIKGDVDRFTKTGVVTTDGRELGPFDVILAATGYQSDYSFLDPKLQARLGKEADGLWLYRNVLSPDVQGIAFVGSEATTFSNLLTYGLQAEWLGRVLAGKIPLPNAEDQRDDVAAVKEWKRGFVPPSSWRSVALQLHQTYYHDQLVKDAGFDEHRRGWNLLGEYLQPLAGRFYRSFFEAAHLEHEGKLPSPKVQAAKVVRPKRATTAVTTTDEVLLPYGGIPVEKLIKNDVISYAINANGVPALSSRD